MNLFAFIYLLSATGVLVLATTILTINPRQLTNQLFFLVSIVNVVLGFITFELYVAETVETAQFWQRLSFLWPIVIGAYLHFAIDYTEILNRLTKKVRYSLTYIPGDRCHVRFLSGNGSPHLFPVWRRGTAWSLRCLCHRLPQRLVHDE